MRLGMKKQTNKQMKGYTLTCSSFYVILNNLNTVAKDELYLFGQYPAVLCTVYMT